VGVNERLVHLVVDDLPFGGIGSSGMGAYRGEFGFQTFSHLKGRFLQSRFNSAWMLLPLFEKLADFISKLLTMR
jgi:coniferyl-aldehyde dehydrogenase